MQRPLSFLIDTNVLIAAEPYGGDLELQQHAVATFLRRAATNKHAVLVHPASVDDLSRARNASERAQKLAAYTKYARVGELPVPPDVTAVFPSELNGNDERDARILAAFHAGAADFFVTDDQRLIRRARTLGHEGVVMTAVEAAILLGTWHPEAPPAPPLVEHVQPYELDSSQAIFDGLRQDYDPTAFDRWLGMVKRDAPGRRCWIVRDDNGIYEAMALVKIRDGNPVGPGDAIKLTTFKVDERANGRRLGELLLKTVLRWAAVEPNRPPTMFVTVKKTEDKDRLVDFLLAFGFSHVHDAGDERVYVKPLDPPPGSSGLAGLEHHIAYGPPALLSGQPIYVIPIEPRWYSGLFPDGQLVGGASGVMELPGTTVAPGAYGNGIKKAYLARAQAKVIEPGALLLFYRSQGSRRGDGAVLAVGVAEESRRTAEAADTLKYAGKRTVYSTDDVVGMHEAGEREVLTILFRHDRFLDVPWTIHELRTNRVVAGAPQSITRVKSLKGIQWVEEQLNVWR